MDDQPVLSVQLNVTMLDSENRQRTGTAHVNLTPLLNLVRSASGEVAAQQILDVRHAELARLAWDALDPQMKRAAALEIVREQGRRMVRETDWARSLSFFAAVFPESAEREQLAEHYVQSFVAAALERMRTEMNNRQNSYAGEAIRDAMKAHVKFLVAEQVRLDAAASITDPK